MFQAGFAKRVWIFTNWVYNWVIYKFFYFLRVLMTDPFYQNNKFQQQNQQGGQTTSGVQQVPQQQIPVVINTPQLTPQQQQQLQQLAQQEQLIYQYIEQLNNVLKTQKMNPQQQQQIAKQIQQYNAQLQYIVQQKQQLGVIRTSKPITHPQVKRRGKISMKGFLMGCVVLFLLLIGGGALIFYSFVQNPERLASMGLGIDTAKQFLQALVSVFFGLLVFMGFGLLVVDMYRIFTVKNKKKIGYIVGSIVWLLIFILAIAAWMRLLTIVGDVAPNDAIDSQNLLIPYAQLKSWPVLVTEKVPLIWPINVMYRLNGSLFNSQVITKLGPVDAQQMTIMLDCWNDKKIWLDMNTLQFQGSCFYVEKGNHQLLIEINYTNMQTQEKISQSISAGFITVSSAVTLTNHWDVVGQNQNKTELVLWKVPRKVTFDASSIFEDFGLGEYKISWDVDDDGQIDKENDIAYTHVYKKAQVYNVNFRIPDLNDNLYTFPIRIEQSDVPVCEVTPTLLKGTEYALDTVFIDNNEIIIDYIFSIVDVKENKIIDTINSSNSNLKYKFPGAWTYAVQTTFQTSEGKKGSCESNNILLGASDFELYYDIAFKSPSAPDFKSAESIDNISVEDNTIILGEIPTIIQIKINRIIPENTNTTKRIILDGEPILSLDEKTFEIPIDESKIYDLHLVVEDVNRDIKTEEVFIVQVKRDDIIGKIIITPDSVGVDPFTVRFDASTSIVNDSEDEIIYFTRDFGDGEVKKDISQAIVEHVYKYDLETENGAFEPQLILTTRKWRKIEVGIDMPIIVKKQQKSFTINLDSHPWQLAQVGDRIQFSLDIDGLPETIHRDFGNGNTLECKARECIETMQVYKDPGTFKVIVKITEADQTPVESTITIKVD